MIKLIALYRRPEDEVAFMAHYQDTHLPLVRNTPGLEMISVSRVIGAPLGGEAPFFLVAEMTFPNRAVFDAAMQSEENRLAGKDLMRFAKGLVTLLAVETSDAR